MKLHSFIILFCCLVYVTELAVMPSFCGPSQKPEKSCSRLSAGRCNRSSADSPCNKEPKKANTTDCCINNCPLFYVMTVSDVAMPGHLTGFTTSAYPPYQSNYLFEYCAANWKPPDGC